MATRRSRLGGNKRRKKTRMRKPNVLLVDLEVSSKETFVVVRHVLKRARRKMQDESWSMHRDKEKCQCSRSVKLKPQSPWYQMSEQPWLWLETLGP